MPIRILILLLPLLAACAAPAIPARFDDLIGQSKAEVIARYGSPDAETWINDRQTLTYIMDEHRLPSATSRSATPRLHQCRMQMDFDGSNILRSVRQTGNCHND